MQVERKPYELLVRWDTDGNLLGAHVQWSNVVTNDDGSKQIFPITVEPVALGDLFLLTCRCLAENARGLHRQRH